MKSGEDGIRPNHKFCSMHKRYLPVLFAFVIILNSCNRPSSEATNNSSDSIPADTVENGNMDGDIFFTDSLKEIVNGNADSTEDEEVTEEDRTSVHSAAIEVCGFSNDGKYFVFTQMVPGDYGDGASYVFVIDVAKNEWAHKPVVLTLNELDYTIDEIRDTLNQKRDSVLSKYKIKLGNVGKSFDLQSRNDVVANNQRYNLDLRIENNLIELRLKGNGKDILLQKDKKLPASRGPVRAYRLNKAVTFGDKIAVFVEYDGEVQEGFENSRYYDRKYIAVTAVIK